MQNSFVEFVHIWENVCVCVCASRSKFRLFFTWRTLFINWRQRKSANFFHSLGNFSATPESRRTNASNREKNMTTKWWLVYSTLAHTSVSVCYVYLLPISCSCQRTPLHFIIFTERGVICGFSLLLFNHHLSSKFLLRKINNKSLLERRFIEVRLSMFRRWIFILPYFAHKLHRVEGVDAPVFAIPTTLR